MVDIERRKHERISIQMPTRMWLDEVYRGKQILFEGHSVTNDLAIGGTFLVSDYLLPVGFPLNLEMRINDHEFLTTRAEIVHSIAADEGQPSGMGVMFTEVDAENRERLLRFFVSERIGEFYNEKFLVEFPHLEPVLSLEDVALVINLWEDKEGRLTSLRKPPTDEIRKTHRQRESQATQRRRRR